MSPDSFELAWPLFTFLRSECHPSFNEPPDRTAINILIVGTLQDSLSLCVCVYVDWIQDARTPTRFTFDAHRIARDRERLRASTYVWRVHALEKGQVLRFVSADSVYRPQAYDGREQVYGLFQAICYRRRHIFKASRDRDIAALNFRYAHARASDRTRETSHNAGVSISGNPRFRCVIAETSCRYQFSI